MVQYKVFSENCVHDKGNSRLHGSMRVMKVKYATWKRIVQGGGSINMRYSVIIFLILGICLVRVTVAGFNWVEECCDFANWSGN